MCDIVDLEVVAPIDASFLVLLIGWTPEDGPKEKLAQVPAGSVQEHMDIIFIAEEPGAVINKK